MPTFKSLSTELAHRVDAFEVALAADPSADFAPFVPEPTHPLYLPLLGELIRIDLERSWSDGRGRRLAYYTARFPIVLEHRVLLGAVAFEEYRQRCRAGQSVRAEEYGK